VAPLLGALSILYLLTPAATRAGELELATGFERSMPNLGNTYTWAIEYREPFSEHLAGELYVAQ
jgi:hypothetical protein